MINLNLALQSLKIALGRSFIYASWSSIGRLHSILYWFSIFIWLPYLSWLSGEDLLDAGPCALLASAVGIPSVYLLVGSFEPTIILYKPRGPRKFDRQCTLADGRPTKVQMTRSWFLFGWAMRTVPRIEPQLQND